MNAENKKKTTHKIFGDSYNLVKKYPNRWDFGPSGTGDITETRNIRYYAGIMKDADLVTSYCGEDMGDPTNMVYQDKTVAYLNFCQLLMILNGTKRGADTVAKLFLPLSLNIIVCMNYIMYMSFGELYFYKTLINAGSGEVYLVGKNYKPLTEEQLESLFEIKEHYSDNLIFVDIPESYLDHYNTCMSFFIQRHVTQIQRNIYYYENPSALLNEAKLETIYRENVKEWINFYRFK